MASLEPRKKYREDSSNVPPPATEPLQIDNPAEAAATAAIKQRLDEQSGEETTAPAAAPPAENETSALQQRLREMEQAEGNARERLRAEAAAQVAAAQQQQHPEIPAAVQKWLNDNPQYLDPNNMIAQTELNLATMKCARDGLTWDNDDFVPRLERYLGRAQATNGNGHLPDALRSPQREVSAPSPAAPPRQPVVQRQSAPVSAPPTRETPSFSGKPGGNNSVTLNAEEKQVAIDCKLPNETDQQAIQRYALNKLKMLRADGRIP